MVAVKVMVQLEAGARVSVPASKYLPVLVPVNAAPLLVQAPVFKPVITTVLAATPSWVAMSSSTCTLVAGIVPVLLTTMLNGMTSFLLAAMLAPGAATALAMPICWGMRVAPVGGGLVLSPLGVLGSATGGVGVPPDATLLPADISVVKAFIPTGITKLAVAPLPDTVGGVAIGAAVDTAKTRLSLALVGTAPRFG